MGLPTKCKIGMAVFSVILSIGVVWVYLETFDPSQELGLSLVVFVVSFVVLYAAFISLRERLV